MAMIAESALCELRAAAAGKISATDWGGPGTDARLRTAEPGGATHAHSAAAAAASKVHSTAAAANVHASPAATHMSATATAAASAAGCERRGCNRQRE
jgi:hypothetical protein